ncbi:unnamed protein product [Cuscuta epithymum]|uniref:Retrotransposon gag domain-containing protein n=1 Tax=Cuscuta epithymum TaxID=186058 RepID=A0AAV0CB78_9ASTE|nr:unnamed protein product [Cuscuta epithymum]
MAAWNRLENIFHDNKNSRAVYLEDQFSHTRLENFPSVFAYCQELRTIATQLANVDAEVTDKRLVLRMIHGLTEPYATVASFIQQIDPLPPFEKARSMLILEETRQSHHASSTSSSPSASALAATSSSRPVSHPQASSISRGRGGGRHSSNRGKGRGRNSGGRTSDATVAPSQWPFPPWAPWMQPYWSMPPCPYFYHVLLLQPILGVHF